MFDLNVLQPVMEHRFLLKLHMALIITIYHGRIQHLIRRSRNQLTEPQAAIYFSSIVLSATDFCFLLTHDIVTKLKLKHIQVALLLSSALDKSMQL
jgi:hypothetical protein